MSNALFERPDDLIRRVYSYVAYRIGPGAEAEDVTSATIERAYRYRSNYDPSLGAPIAWLLGIAGRCIRDALSERDSTASPEFEGLLSPDHSESADERLSVQHAVATLSERDRDLIALRYGADLSARQIGHLIGSKTNAVEVALHRALGRLRNVLDAPVAAPITAPSPQPQQLDHPVVDAARSQV